MTQEDKVLYQRVDEILHYIWDPIGVREAPLARDEYYSYLPGVFKLLKSGADSKQLARYLMEVERSSMGLTPSTARLQHVADVLMDATEALLSPRQ